MQHIKKYGIVIFWATLFVDCYFLFTEKYVYHSYLKSVLVPILGFYVFLNARKNYNFRSKMLIFVGFLCAWLGDIFLLQEGDNFFIMGMIAFIGTHIFYGIYFYRLNMLNSTKGTEALVISILILLAIGYQTHSFLEADLALVPQLKIPIYIFSIFLFFMAAMAANVFANKSKKSLAINYFIPGAILFIFSDVILAIYKFKYTDESFLQVIVLISYGYAQCIIAQGFAKYLKS